MLEFCSEIIIAKWLFRFDDWYAVWILFYVYHLSKARDFDSRVINTYTRINQNFTQYLIVKDNISNI